MSWDVMLYNLEGRIPPPVDQFGDDDWVPLGPAEVVRQRIAALLPGTDWSDSTWGRYSGDGFSMEFNIGQEDPIETIMLHIRGGGDAIAAIVAFAQPLGWAAFDTTTGEFMDLENPDHSGWESFQAFRDKVIEQLRNEGKL